MCDKDTIYAIDVIRGDNYDDVIQTFKTFNSRRDASSYMKSAISRYCDYYDIEEKDLKKVSDFRYINSTANHQLVMHRRPKRDGE